MLLTYIYYTFLIICTSYAVYRGHRSEYAGAAIMIIGSLASLFNGYYFGTTWTGMELGVFAIDVIALGALLHLAIVSDRFWPIWAAGFHLLAVAVHLSIMFAPNITPWAFVTGAVFWAYPMLLSLAIGSHEYVNPAERARLQSG